VCGGGGGDPAGCVLLFLLSGKWTYDGLHWLPLSSWSPTAGIHERAGFVTRLLGILGVSWTIIILHICWTFLCLKLTGLCSDPQVGYSTATLVAKWTLYFQTEFKAYLTGCCIKYLLIWDRTNWMWFTFSFKFMPLFVKRPKVLITSLRGWNGN
jgi:hypothetical protein